MIHGPCNVLTGEMVCQIQSIFTTFGIESYLKKLCQSCVTCIRHNPQENMRPKKGQFPKPTYPFQTIYKDFIELTQSGPYKQCLVMIDAFFKWVEKAKAKAADALTVAKVICKSIIPNHGIPETIYSDNGTNFVNQVIQWQTT